MSQMADWKRLAVGHLVDAHGGGQDQRVVLTRSDLDAVCVADPEPALGDLSDLVAVPFDLELVIDDVPLRAELATALDLDRVPIAQRRDQRFLDRRHGVPVAFDLHRVADRELALLDLEDLFPRGRLEDEGLANPHRLAVDLENAIPAVGLDPVIVADREQLFAHAVARAGGVGMAVQESHAVDVPRSPHRAHRPFRVTPEPRPARVRTPRSGGATPGARTATSRDRPAAP